MTPDDPDKLKENPDKLKEIDHNPKLRSVVHLKENPDKQKEIDHNPKVRSVVHHHFRVLKPLSVFAFARPGLQVDGNCPKEETDNRKEEQGCQNFAPQR